MENYSIYVTNAPPKKPDDFRRVFVMLRNRILHDAVHRAACGVNPGSLIYPQAKKRKRRAFFV